MSGESVRPHHALPSVDAVVSPIGDRLALYLLLALTMGYDLQHLLPWVTSFKVRECLLLFLYARILLAYRGWLTKIAAHLIVFYATSIVIGVVTFMRYGAELASLGTARFLFLALIALPVAVIGRRHMGTLVAIWLVIVVFGAITAVLQLSGVDLGWLVRESVSVRGGLVRFRTILGEPNKGGMASAVLVLASATIIRAPSARTLAMAAALVLLALSLSKAALIGWVLVVVFLVGQTVISGDSAARQLLTRRLLWGAAAMTVAVAAVLAIDHPQTRLAREYLGQVMPALTGAAQDSKGLSEDLNDRLLARGQRGLELARMQSDWYAPELVIGSSYGVAGSVAVELRGETLAILPHNTVLELFLVGGLWMLLLFAALLARSTAELSERAQSAQGVFAVAALPLLAAYALSYPIIYEPIMGSLMWMMIGSAAGLQAGLRERSAS